MSLLFLLLLISSRLSDASTDGFYSFGESVHDKKIDYSLDQNAVALDVPFIFMEQSVDEIYVSHNGIVGLNHRAPDKVVPLQNINHTAIVVYYAPTSAGHIYYRVTSSDQHILQRLTADVKQVFADSSEFRGIQAIIITWIGVQNSETDGAAEFQLAIVSDGQSTYSVVHYGTLPWSSSMGYYAQTGFVRSAGKYQTNMNSGSPDVKELVNLSNNQFGNSFIFRISGPQIEDPREEGGDEYDYNSYDQEYDGETPSDCPKDKFLNNCPKECQFVRDERGCPRCLCAEKPSRPIAPPQPNTIDDDDDSSEEEEIRIPAAGIERIGGGAVETCARKDEKACHTHSICQDYSSGYCCSCEPGHFGNGKECLPKGEPQRISGSFEGVINRTPIDRTDLHTFATANDGNVFTAISKIPSDLGDPLKLLNAIGSVMGWLFADVQSPSVSNGFQITGGLFNRTVAIHVGNHYVTIRQEFGGRNIHDYLESHLFVSGTLPDIAPGSEVLFPDYDEEYVRERQGYLTSHAAFDVRVVDNGNTQVLRMVIDQQINFEECPHQPITQESKSTLKVKRVSVVYNEDEGIVRFSSKNYASKSGERAHGATLHIPPSQEADPCSSGQHTCTLANMRCRVVEPSYRCECEPGYQAQHDTNSPIGWVCQDLDECQRGDHNCAPHATCSNKPGSFGCECQPGYIGDGRTCLREQSDASREQQAAQQQQQQQQTQALGEGSCTAHSQCHQWGECVFTAEHPTGRCKCRGWYVGDGVQHCGPPEKTQPAIQPQQHVQPRGQVCGTFVCDPNAECLPEPSGGSECVCKAGFAGNGVQCESLLPDAHQQRHPAVQHPAQPPAQLDNVCRSHEECNEHGSCAYHQTLGYYQCVCTEPYIGNGVDCSLPGSSPVSDVGCDVTNDCSEFADCVYEGSASGPSFRCICRSGYTGDGKYCMQTQLAISSLNPNALLPPPPPIHPSESCNPNCGENSQCVYDDHNRQYRCECYAAFIGDGYNCVPLTKPVHYTAAQPKTCVESSDCHINGHCVIDENGAGEYICECLPGFKGDGFINCQGSDQCNPSDPNACYQNAKCVYDETQNGHICKCVDGFKGADATSCVPYAPATNCQIEPRICHANAQCVLRHETATYECLCKPGAVGDGYLKCEVLETPRCSNCSHHAYCHQNPSGAYQCKCDAGYLGNGHLCVAMTSCLDDRSLCDTNADCVPGEGGHYICNCHYGYHGDGRTCSPDSSHRSDKLLVARGMAIFERSTNPDEYGKQLIVIPHHIPVAIDFDCEEERIVWSDMSGHSIRTSSLNGTDHKSYFSKELSSPEGIAVDWSSRNVYYADSMNDEIGVASLDGKYKKTLISEGLVNPRALTIDLAGKHLYYSDWHRENPYIGRIDLDGLNNRVFINDDVHLPNGLTILPNRRELCWVDAGVHRLSCISFNGDGRRTVFSSLQYPFGLTHENEQKFYWTDWKDNRIHSVGIYGEGYRSFQISLGGSGKVFGILSIPKTCPGARTECGDDNGGCDYLCLPGQTGASCTCPDNVDVKGC